MVRPGKPRRLQKRHSGNNHRTAQRAALVAVATHAAAEPGRQTHEIELAAILGVPMAMLPEVCPSAGAFGETVAHEGLAAGIPVAGIAGDQQAALYGQGCWGPGQAKNTYVSIHGLEASRAAATRETAHAIDACGRLPGTNATFLEALIRKLEFRLH